MNPLQSILARVAYAVAALALASCSRGCVDSSSVGPASSSGAAPRVSGGPVPRTARLDGAKTTKEILSQLAPDCYPCAEKNGCLVSAQGGGACETAPATATVGGPDEVAMCLDALRCVFTTKCANTDEETQCLCGKTDVIECMEGKSPPQGSCVAEFKKDFGDDGKKMYDNFLKQEYGAGRANALIQCVMPLCPSCRIR